MRCNINYNKGINQVKISRSLVQECVLRVDQFMIIRKIIKGVELPPKGMRPFFFFFVVCHACAFVHSGKVKDST